MKHRINESIVAFVGVGTVLCIFFLFNIFVPANETGYK